MPRPKKAPSNLIGALRTLSTVVNQVKQGLDNEPDDGAGDGARVFRTLQVVQSRAALLCVSDELDRLAKQVQASEAGPRKPRGPNKATNGAEGPGVAKVPGKRGRPRKLPPLEAVANE